MKIKAYAGVKKSELVDFCVVFTFSDKENLWSEILKKEAFTGEFKSEFFLVDKETKLLFFGLGSSENFNLDRLARSFASFARLAEKYRRLRIGLVLPKTVFSDWQLGKVLMEGINLALYRFEKYKTKKKEFGIEELSVYLDGMSDSRIKSFNRGMEEGNLFSIAVNYGRDLVNEPAAVSTPTFLASEALKLKKGNENIEVEVFDAKKMQKMGMEATLAIGRGSTQEAKFIKIEYKPRHPSKKVVLVGKGLTFDSGGLSLKSSGGMETMKIDMSGAAATLAVFKIIEKLKLKLHVVGLVSAVENMPSGSAVRPGDVVLAYNKKTIEILNTDAEGRVTLADALSFGASLRPNYLIDMATLTGACVVALGEEISGIMGNDQVLLERILAAAKEENERVWQLPLEERYQDMLKSHVADVKNTTKKWGGAITAGLFLREFVDKCSWAHLDIAGPVWEEKGNEIFAPGATGHPIKTILRFLLSL